MTTALPTTDFGVDIPFVKHLGFVLTVCAGGQSEITYAPQQEHLNSYSVVHGGAVMTLLDVTMAMAARADLEDMGVVTIEMKTSFMQPSRGHLTARGRLMHRTATLAFTEATVFDAHGKPCAHATGTFKFIRRLPTGPKSSQPLNGSKESPDA
jgi:uncharacterized protein (TIGR00369 family)